MNGRVGLRVACACAGVVVLAGCTSSGSTAASSSVPPPSPSTSAVSTSASPTPMPTPSSSAPLSPFEQDPGVKALRAFAVQAARTINTGHEIDTKLRALVTPFIAKNIKYITGSDVGLYYPGPVPFTPVSVRVVSSTQRQMNVCFIGKGFAEKRSTMKPAAPLMLLKINAGEQLQGGTWRISMFNTATNFSCAGVSISRPLWSS